MSNQIPSKSQFDKSNRNSFVLQNVFHAKSSSPVEANVEPWDYIDENDGKELQGFFSMPEGKGPFPTIVMLP